MTLEIAFNKLQMEGILLQEEQVLMDLEIRMFILSKQMVVEILCGLKPLEDQLLI